MNSELTVEVTKIVNAPIDKVFNAWVEPEQLKQWYSPEGMTAEAASVEPKKGGKYSVTMKMGDQKFDHSGEYLEYNEPNPSTGSGQARLVFTWSDTSSVVAVNFKSLNDGKTEVTLKHTGFVDEQSRINHDQGWTGTFNKMFKYLQ